MRFYEIKLKKEKKRNFRRWEGSFKSEWVVKKRTHSPLGDETPIRRTWGKSEGEAADGLCIDQQELDMNLSWIYSAEGALQAREAC